MWLSGLQLQKANKFLITLAPSAPNNTIFMGGAAVLVSLTECDGVE